LKRAAILTDDGTVIAAQSIGSDEITVGEIVFNTSMTGYQEMITDLTTVKSSLSLIHILETQEPTIMIKNPIRVDVLESFFVTTQL
jgi:hypothetical protein